MFGGAYLCYEGVEKVYEIVLPHHAHAHEARARHGGTRTPNAFEDEKVAGAIKTDFILRRRSWRSRWQPFRGELDPGVRVLAVVGIGITVAVYGVVALIVKADDAGVALARNRIASTVTGAVSRAIGRGPGLGMPGFLTFLSVAGTAAMIWVGGGIIVHGRGLRPGSIGHASTLPAKPPRAHLPLVGRIRRVHFNDSRRGDR